MGAGRPPIYTEADKAKVYVVLEVNDGNIKRTARDTGISIGTIRRWRNEWLRTRSTPETSLVAVSIGNFLADAETGRDLAMTTLMGKIPDAKPGELVNIIGMLDDKITRAKGLATKKVEHVHTLPSAEEVTQALSGFMEAARQASLQRQVDVIDAELVMKPQLSLPR